MRYVHRLRGVVEFTGTAPGGSVEPWDFILSVSEHIARFAAELQPRHLILPQVAKPDQILAMVRQGIAGLDPSEAQPGFTLQRNTDDIQQRMAEEMELGELLQRGARICGAMKRLSLYPFCAHVGFAIIIAVIDQMIGGACYGL